MRRSRSITSAHGRNNLSSKSPPDSLVETYEAGVIDLGSNSVRLVVYRIDGRTLTPTLNEKVTAALGRDLIQTGTLSEGGVQAALKAIARYVAVLEALGVKRVHAVATAAVRDAADGEAFAKAVLKNTGLKLRVLSGAEEARLSALGVVGGIPEAHGVVGDLGGSSLELVEVNEGEIGAGETFRLGHLALGAEGPFSYDRIVAAVDSALEQSQNAALKRGGNLYAVGGAWRALGRIDMALANHPMRVLHHHEMSRAEVLKITDFVRRQSRRSLEKLEEAAAKRAESLPYASVVLERLMLRGKFERLIISSSGLREGVLLDGINTPPTARHPLIAACEAFAGPSKRARLFGRALEPWIEPAFANVEGTLPDGREPLIRAAATRLADFGSALHPDQRAEIMFDLILRAPLAGITHVERAFLAAAIHYRHTKAAPEGAGFVRLLNEDQRRNAAAVGAALRLGAEASARAPDLLARFTLSRDGAVLTLTAPSGEPHLVSDSVVRRLDAFAAALGLTARIALEG